MFGLGLPELLIILFIILVVFGAGKLPQIGEGLGKGISNFRRSLKDKDDEDDPDYASNVKEKDEHSSSSAGAKGSGTTGSATQSQNNS